MTQFELYPAAPSATTGAYNAFLSPNAAPRARSPDEGADLRVRRRLDDTFADDDNYEPQIVIPRPISVPPKALLLLREQLTECKEKEEAYRQEYLSAKNLMHNKRSFD